MSYLGPFILSRLRAKNWKQKDLAAKVEINESTLNRYISGKQNAPRSGHRTNCACTWGQPGSSENCSVSFRIGCTGSCMITQIPPFQC